MQLDGVEQDQIKLRAFPFSLVDAAKDWLYYLPAGSIATWTALENAFLEKFLPASRIGAIRKEICGIKQRVDESLYEYRERFNRLCASCPQHQISNELLIQYFYDGLSLKDKSIIDAASGGVLMNKTATEAKLLIDNMALNSQQYSSRDDIKGVSGVDLSGIKNELQENSQQIANLTTLMSKLVSSNSHVMNVSHAPNENSLMAEDVNALNGFPNSYQKKYDPFSPTYNEGWRDNPNLRYGPPRPNQSYGAPRNFIPNNVSPQSQNSNASPSLEDMLKQLTTQIGQVHSQGTQYQQKTDAHLRQLDAQISQVCTSLSNIESKLSGSLPSQPLPNPTEKAKAMTLRSGKQLEQPKTKNREIEEELEVGSEINKGENEKQKNLDIEQPKEKWSKSDDKVKSNSDLNVHTFRDAPSFPSRFAKAKKEALENEILETFRKVEVNIPLLDAIKQVPKYAKFLKELCTNKRKFKNERASVGENLSAILQRKIPPKCKDPGMFSITCKIGNSKFERCMLDLGASINVMPKSIFESLNVGVMAKTDVVIQLADRSYAYPLGVLEDVLVQVNDMIFPADFYVIDMGNSCDSDHVPLLLGRPFLKTARAKIDVYEGTLSFEFDGEVIKFSINDAMKYPLDVSSVSSIDTINVVDWIAQESFEKDYQYLVNFMSFEMGDSNAKHSDVERVVDNVSVTVTDVASSADYSAKVGSPTCFSSLELRADVSKLIPSIKCALELELKPLPAELKYAYLGENETLPVIIASLLSDSQEKKLLNVLSEYKEAIGWTIADIKGISPTLCMHKIYLENDSKPVRESQRRLNPAMMEVVKKEIIKWRDADIIFPISDSKWVSPIHVVPKKSGITVVENSVDTGMRIPNSTSPLFTERNATR
ncbi:hypothetical protein RND81_10G086100 [Saponaria officinalis]|uniref:Retrotransposon gag domain-containing protein n=1 Tax=Saponaria officinalis TaxID=3572 RepID=A0AAW1I1Z8_SAPOF